MTEIENLRELLREARVWVAHSESFMIMRNGEGWSEQIKLLDRIDEALAPHEPVVTDYDRKLSACHQYGLCVDSSLQFGPLQEYRCQKCEICPRRK